MASSRDPSLGLSARGLPGGQPASSGAFSSSLAPGSQSVLQTVADFERVATAALSTSASERTQAEALLLVFQQQSIASIDLCMAVLEQSQDPASLSVAVVMLRNGALSQWCRRQLAYEGSAKASAGDLNAKEMLGPLAEFEAKIVLLIQAMLRLLQAHAVLQQTDPVKAAQYRVSDRQMTYALAVLLKKGLASGTRETRDVLRQLLVGVLAEMRTLLLPATVVAPQGRAGVAEGTSVLEALAASQESPHASSLVLRLSVLMEVSREVGSSQLSLLQLSTQQHVECKKQYEREILLPLVDLDLSLLNLLLKDQQGPAAQRRGPPDAAKQRDSLLATVVGILELLMDWNFGQVFLRFVTTSDVSFAPTADWLPVFFPSSSASAELQKSRLETCVLPPGPAQERPNLFALILGLYRYLSARRNEDPSLFKVGRLILMRLTRFRAHRMVEALFGAGGAKPAFSAAASGDPRAIPSLAAALGATRKDASATSPGISRSCSGPIGRSKKQQVTALVYVPLLNVLLDLLEKSPFLNSPLAGGAVNAAIAAALPTVSIAESPLELTEDDTENLEEVQDLCLALYNLAECNEAIPEYLMDGVANKALPLFVRVSTSLVSVILRSGLNAASQHSRGEWEEGIEAAVGSLEVFLRSWSVWADKLHQQVLQPLKPSAASPENGGAEPGIKERPWWPAFENAVNFVISVFIGQGLSICCHKETDVAATPDANDPRGAASSFARALVGGAGGSPLDDFLRCFAVLGRTFLVHSLQQTFQKFVVLKDQVTAVRRQQAAAGTTDDAVLLAQQKRGENLLDELNFTLLLTQQLITISVSGEGKGQKLVPPPQVLKDEETQRQVIQVCGQVFSLLQGEITLLKEHQVRSFPLHFLGVSPTILESGVNILSAISAAYLLRSRFNQPMLADFILPEKGQEAMNVIVQIVAELLHLLPHEESLTLCCTRTLQILSSVSNPTVAYLWESPAFQALLTASLESCATLLPSTLPSRSNSTLGGEAKAADGQPLASYPSFCSTRQRLAPLQQLTQRTMMRLYSSFSSSTAMNEHLWGLAKMHVAQQTLERSGTLLANEVVVTRQQQLLAKCEPLKENLRRLAANAADTHPRIFHALGSSLSMAIGLLDGCTPQSISAWIVWLRDALDAVFAIASKYLQYPHILHNALKFFLQLIKRGYNCFDQTAAVSLFTQYKALIQQVGNHYATLVVGSQEEDSIFGNLKQSYKVFQLLAANSKDTSSFSWIVEMLVACMQTLQPMTAKLRPREQPKVAVPLLMCLQVLAEEDSKKFLALTRDTDVKVLMHVLRESVMTESGRIRQPAYEILHAFCRYLTALQVGQQVVDFSLERPEGRPDPFASPAPGDTVGTLFTHLAQLSLGLLAHALSSPLSNADLDFFSDCIFDLFFMVGLRAYALHGLLANFTQLYAANLAAGSAGALSAGSPAGAMANSVVLPSAVLETRLGSLMQTIIQGEKELVGVQYSNQSGAAGQPAADTPAAVSTFLEAGSSSLIKYQRQQHAFRDLFKYFVVECASPAAAGIGDSSARK
ncbi:hypothetical protein BESB_054250 [Besnoitia besnoiti]|uniref:Uncharacterized protein n=1 Tax=Besnoitia besnoiti TaxID=94643 RepID=A0A2A9MEZ2_BESBE|nr:hypothetical protein BESB_054250 [Besnoitia besnoiti]PFH35774.1 hypothetical protein BESB_054250 [Besnoitia besnoiti]